MHPSNLYIFCYKFACLIYAFIQNITWNRIVCFDVTILTRIFCFDVTILNIL